MRWSRSVDRCGADPDASAHASAAGRTLCRRRQARAAREAARSGHRPRRCSRCRLRARRRHAGGRVAAPFCPAARALAQRLHDNELGEVAVASVHVPWWRPQTYYDEPGRGTLERDGGGVLITQAIHTLDLFLSLTPRVSEVAAFAATTPLHRMETEDIACAALRFVNGALGTLSATTASYPGFAERIEIVGTRGTALLTAGKVELHWQDGRRETLGEEATLGGGADPMAFSNEAHRAVLADSGCARGAPRTRQQWARSAARARSDRRRAGILACESPHSRSPTSAIMKISAARVIVTCPGRNFVTLKIETDEGVTGIGDATLNGRCTTTTAATRPSPPSSSMTATAARASCTTPSSTA